VIAETVRIDDDGKNRGDVEPEVEFTPFVASNVLEPLDIKDDYNLLIPQQQVFNFIRTNFVCKKCHSTIKKKNLVTDRVGCACNVFWKCSNTECDALDKILSKPSMKEASGKFWEKASGTSSGTQ
jgi:hypothetical protein